MAGGIRCGVLALAVGEVLGLGDDACAGPAGALEVGGDVLHADHDRLAAPAHAAATLAHHDVAAPGAQLRAVAFADPELSSKPKAAPSHATASRTSGYPRTGMTADAGKERLFLTAIEPNGATLQVRE